MLGLDDFSRFGLLVVREAVAVLVANNLHDQWGALTVDEDEADLQTEGTRRFVAVEVPIRGDVTAIRSIKPTTETMIEVK